MINFLLICFFLYNDNVNIKSNLYSDLYNSLYSIYEYILPSEIQIKKCITK